MAYGFDSAARSHRSFVDTINAAYEEPPPYTDIDENPSSQTAVQDWLCHTVEIPADIKGRSPATGGYTFEHDEPRFYGNRSVSPIRSREDSAVHELGDSQRDGHRETTETGHYAPAELDACSSVRRLRDAARGNRSFGDRLTQPSHNTVCDQRERILNLAVELPALPTRPKFEPEHRRHPDAAKQRREHGASEVLDPKDLAHRDRQIDNCLLKLSQSLGDHLEADPEARKLAKYLYFSSSTLQVAIVYLKRTQTTCAALVAKFEESYGRMTTSTNWRSWHVIPPLFRVVQLELVLDKQSVIRLYYILLFLGREDIDFTFLNPKNNMHEADFWMQRLLGTRSSFDLSMSQLARLGLVFRTDGSWSVQKSFHRYLLRCLAKETEVHVAFRSALRIVSHATNHEDHEQTRHHIDAITRKDVKPFWQAIYSKISPESIVHIQSIASFCLQMSLSDKAEKMLAPLLSAKHPADVLGNDDDDDTWSKAEMRTFWLLGRTHIEKQEYVTAQQHLSHALEKAWARRSKSSAEIEIDLAIALLCTRQVEKAQTILLTLAKHTDRLRSSSVVHNLFCALGQLAAQQGDFEEAKNRLDQALDCTDDSGDQTLQHIRTQVLLGSFHMHTEDFEQAEEVLLEAKGAATRLLGTLHPETREICRAYGEALLACADSASPGEEHVTEWRKTSRSASPTCWPRPESSESSEHDCLEVDELSDDDEHPRKYSLLKKYGFTGRRKR